MFGLLNVDKPAGVTSRDVVNHVQRIVRPLKVGHAGTLDPLATGVIVLCLGKATRLMEYVQRQAKSYRGTFLLGRTSDTEDTEGQITEVEGRQPTADEMAAALTSFVGDIEQRPPAYSALKVRGQRAYTLARAGKAVDLPPRPVTVHSIALVSYCYPELVLDIRCGAGTYIRSLGRDIAESLGTAAVMSNLVRTAVGGFSLQKAHPLKSLDADSIDSWLESPTLAVAMMPKITLDRSQIDRICQGQPIAAPEDLNFADQEWAGIDSEGRLVAILRTKNGTSLKPAKNFSNA